MPAGTLLGHPQGLFLLFATEMWERFSYYGMRALLVLSLVAGVETANPGSGWTQAEALKLYGLFTGFVYFTPLIGGWLADNYIGQRKSVIIGGLVSSTLLGGIVTPGMYRLLPPKIEPQGPEQRDAALALG